MEDNKLIYSSSKEDLTIEQRYMRYIQAVDEAKKKTEDSAK